MGGGRLATAQLKFGWVGHTATGAISLLLRMLLPVQSLLNGQYFITICE